MKLLVTGGAGFIGSNFIRHVLGKGEVSVVNLDVLTYAGNLENLAGLEDSPDYTFVHGDICHRDPVVKAMEGVDAVVHFAAESHVDRSIESAFPFVQTNVVGTQNLLALARELEVGRFVHVSTDEVYGELEWRDPDMATYTPDDPGPFFTEETPLSPRSPYSASKAGSDLLALSYHRTHGLDVVVTRCTNNYGPYQFPEKLVPLMIANALEDEPLPVYGDGLNIRDWIHVDDHCRGVEAALHRGKAGEVYNFGGHAERTNLQVVREILGILGKGEDAIRFVADRKGHDRRYAVLPEKARRELGWVPEVEFPQGMADTVAWYAENRDWWQRVRSGEYRDYYQRMYGTGGRYQPG
ncbi:MAG: dTDP-glucose 4,6-dehydratase [Gemmatimonadota bacterium]